jgi:hypothetical protein
MSCDSDYRAIHKYNKEFLNRVDDRSLSEVFCIFLRRISLTLVGKDNLSTLNRILNDSIKLDGHDNSNGDVPRKLLALISNHFPQVFKSQVTNLRDLIIECNDHNRIGN